MIQDLTRRQSANQTLSVGGYPAESNLLFGACLNVADLVEECRKAMIVGSAPSLVPYHPHISNAFDVIGKCGPEIEKLRKEVKLLKARNASLVWRLVWVMLIFGGLVLGTFMAVFLSS